MFPAGLYFIGDLCHVINQREWDCVCDILQPVTSFTKIFPFKLSNGRRGIIANTDSKYIAHENHGRFLIMSESVGVCQIKNIEKITSSMFGICHDFDVPFDISKKKNLIKAHDQVFNLEV